MTADSLPILNTSIKSPLSSFLVTALDDLEQHDNGFFQLKLGGSIVSKLPRKVYDPRKATEEWYKTQTPRMLTRNTYRTPKLPWGMKFPRSVADLKSGGLPLFNIYADCTTFDPPPKLVYEGPRLESAYADNMKPRRIINERKVGPFIDYDEVTDNEDEENAATTTGAAMTGEQTLRSDGGDAGAALSAHTTAVEENGGDEVVEKEGTEEAGAGVLDGRIKGDGSALRPLEMTSDSDSENGTTGRAAAEPANTTNIRALGAGEQPLQGEVEDGGVTLAAKAKKSHGHRAKRSVTQKGRRAAES